MDKDVFIFIGRSGCGKGTQKDLLIKKLQDIGMPFLSIYTGDSLRSFISSHSFVAQKVKSAVATGDLAPSFVASTMWSQILMDQYQENQSLIFDGSPRTLDEAQELENAIKFLGFISPVVINLNVSNSWSRDRLLARKREDDSVEAVNKRLAWYEASVSQVVSYYRSNSFYCFKEINGEQTIPKVAEDILSALPYLKQAPVANRMKSLQYVDTKDSLETSIQQNGKLETQNFIRSQNP